MRESLALSFAVAEYVNSSLAFPMQLDRLQEDLTKQTGIADTVSKENLSPKKAN